MVHQQLYFNRRTVATRFAPVVERRELNMSASLRTQPETAEERACIKPSTNETIETIPVTLFKGSEFLRVRSNTAQ